MESKDAPLRCLIVDDSLTFRDAARRILERDGLVVVGMASAVAEGLSSARTLKPDVTLVDVHLGAESGFDLARKLREEQRATGAIVVLISAHPERELLERQAETSADAFVAKSALSGAAIRAVARGSAAGSPLGEKGHRR